MTTVSQYGFSFNVEISKNHKKAFQVSTTVFFEDNDNKEQFVNYIQDLLDEGSIEEFKILGQEYTIIVLNGTKPQRKCNSIIKMFLQLFENLLASPFCESCGSPVQNFIFEDAPKDEKLICVKCLRYTEALFTLNNFSDALEAPSRPLV